MQKSRISFSVRCYRHKGRMRKGVPRRSRTIDLNVARPTHFHQAISLISILIQQHPCQLKVIVACYPAAELIEVHLRDNEDILKETYNKHQVNILILPGRQTYRARISALTPQNGDDVFCTDSSLLTSFYNKSIVIVIWTWTCTVSMFSDTFGKDSKSIVSDTELFMFQTLCARVLATQMKMARCYSSSLYTITSEQLDSLCARRWHFRVSPRSQSAAQRLGPQATGGHYHNQ